MPTADPDISAEGVRVALDSGLPVWLTVRGGCMEPQVRDGEPVVLSRRRPRWGDVVLAVQDGALRLHRLVWAPWSGRWRTKADRAPACDPPIGPEDVLAVVVDAGSRRRATRSLLAAARGRLLRALAAQP